MVVIDAGLKLATEEPSLKKGRLPLAISSSVFFSGLLGLAQRPVA